MKWVAFTLLFLLDISLAGRWKIAGRPETLAKYNGDGRVTRAVQSAIDLASTAYQVLTTDWNHPRVQSMLQHIMRGGEYQATDILRAREYFFRVVGYEREESRLPIKDLNSNQDVLIFLDNSNHDPRGSVLWFKAQDLPQLADDAQVSIECYSAQPTNDRDVPQALTTRSHSFTDEYIEKRRAWAEKKAEDYKNGVENHEKSPDSTGQYTIQTDKPNNMDVATWFLDMVLAGRALAVVDDSLFDYFENDAFIDGLTNNGKIKPIDALAGELSLAGMFLHELTHTTTGGETEDTQLPPPDGGKAYGWDKIGRVKSIDNADSLSTLAICMWLFRGGYWVDSTGQILGIDEDESGSEPGSPGSAPGRRI